MTNLLNFVLILRNKMDKEMLIIITSMIFSTLSVFVMAYFSGMSTYWMCALPLFHAVVSIMLASMIEEDEDSFASLIKFSLAINSLIIFVFCFIIKDLGADFTGVWSVIFWVGYVLSSLTVPLVYKFVYLRSEYYDFTETDNFAVFVRRSEINEVYKKRVGQEYLSTHTLRTLMKLNEKATDNYILDKDCSLTLESSDFVKLIQLADGFNELDEKAPNYRELSEKLSKVYNDFSLTLSERKILASTDDGLIAEAKFRDTNNEQIVKDTLSLFNEN